MEAVTLQIYIAIPCYNEANRLDHQEIETLLTDESVYLVLVDDGSTDFTLNRLSELQIRHPDRIEVLALEKNVGKAEAVRKGMQRSLFLGASVTGYLDADFATPATEMLRLIEIFRSKKQIKILMAARWLHLGSKIQRRRFRHYAGRVFATIASMVLRMSVYDTQCGAKLFKVDRGLADAIAEPFVSRWAFDVELIARLRRVNETSEFLEVPLDVWMDVSGSKMGLFDMIRATLELFLIGFRNRDTH